MKPNRNLRGFSLPELLIAMLLGLVIAGAALSTLSSASAASKEQRVQAELAQDAYSSLALMAIHLRMAGYKEVPGGVDTYLFGCDSPFENSKLNSIDDLRCGAASTGSSAVAMRYEVDEFNADLDASGVPADCTGKPIAAAGTAEAPDAKGAKGGIDTSAVVFESRFFVQTSATTKNPALYCAGNGAPMTFVPQSMADNVEMLRIAYGLDATAWKTAREVDAGSGSRPEKWGAVREVRLCVQMRSDSGVTASRTAYLDCNGKLTVPPVGDTRLHRTFTQSVQVRNAAS